MNALKATWLTDDLIDFEYKKYVLLGYLKEVKTNFQSIKLYPHLSDLVFHYRNLMSFQKSKDELFAQMPKNISKIDWEKLQLAYKNISQDDELMKEIDSLVNYSLPEIKKTIQEGKDLYEVLESHMEMDVVGVMPLYNKEGYLFLRVDQSDDISVHRYHISAIRRSEENFQAISTSYLFTEKYSISRSFESLKIELTRRFKEMPNPATFIINSLFSLPESETFLPIAKRMLIKEIGIV